MFGHGPGGDGHRGHQSGRARFYCKAVQAGPSAENRFHDSGLNDAGRGCAFPHRHAGGIFPHPVFGVLGCKAFGARLRRLRCGAHGRGARPHEPWAGKAAFGGKGRRQGAFAGRYRAPH